MFREVFSIYKWVSGKGPYLVSGALIQQFQHWGRADVTSVNKWTSRLRRTQLHGLLNQFRGSLAWETYQMRSRD